MRLDPQRTQRYMRNFHGFGSPHARWCFVGLEEGGGRSFKQVEARLKAWAKRGCCQLEDLPEFTKEAGSGLEGWFDGEGKLQSTWNKLIHLLLTAKGLLSDRAERRRYQVETWGRRDSETLLTDIYPLPSPGRKEWKYPERVEIPELATRSDYHEYAEPFRLAALNELILPPNGKARIVIIYALAQDPDRLRLLSRLIGVKDPIVFPKNEAIWMDQVGPHLVAVVPQPVRRGFNLDSFADMGRKIRKKAEELGIPLGQ